MYVNIQIVLANIFENLWLTKYNLPFTIVINLIRIGFHDTITALLNTPLDKNMIFNSINTIFNCLIISIENISFLYCAIYISK